MKLLFKNTERKVAGKIAKAIIYDDFKGVRAYVFSIGKIKSAEKLTEKCKKQAFKLYAFIFAISVIYGFKSCNYRIDLFWNIVGKDKSCSRDPLFEYLGKFGQYIGAECDKHIFFMAQSFKLMDLIGKEYAEISRLHSVLL